MISGKAIFAFGLVGLACSLTPLDDLEGTVAGSGGEVSLDSGPEADVFDGSQAEDADSSEADAKDAVTPDAGDGDAAILPPGLVLAYSFSENAGTNVADVSGNGNDGVVNGASWAPGHFGSGLSFDGSVAFVLAPHSAELGLTDELTLEAWVRPAPATLAFQAVLVKNYDYFLYSATGPTACASLGFLGGVRVDGGFIQPCAAAPATNDEWTHLAITYNADGLTLYSNATVVGTQAGMGRSIPSETGTLQVGASQYGEYFVGIIDEIRVYSRALTLAEIQVDMVTPLPP